MTRVRLTKRGNAFTVAADGHATGSKEVCAAVSCLICTLASWLGTHDEIASSIAIRDGAASAEISFSGKEAESVYDFVRTGFLALSERYGEYISVSEE